MNADVVVREVAHAVGLAEGEAGVRAVVRAAARLEPVAVRKLSRATDLPVPIVSAIGNELRKRGVVARERPVQLTPRGRELFPVGSALALDELRLEALALAAPAARAELDQVHCDVATKLRRLRALDDADALAGRRVLLLGDDDLLAAALALARAPLARLTVVDVDAALLSFLRRALRRAAFPFDVVRHDLREPLPAPLARAADTVFTDPPYTVEGATVFLSRAADAVAGPGSDVFVAFGAKRPEDTLEVQRAIAQMGFVVRSLERNFNEYVGAGVLAGSSHLYHLRATKDVRPLVAARHEGRLYTADHRPPLRRYRCRACGRAQHVGGGRRWRDVEQLRRDGCPRCGGQVFVPLARSL